MKHSEFLSRWRPEEVITILDFLEDLKQMIVNAYDEDICQWCEKLHGIGDEEEHTDKVVAITKKDNVVVFTKEDRDVPF